MTRFAVDVDLAGFDRAAAALREMQARARDVSPAWEALLDWWADSNSVHFLTNGRRWSAGWPPLAESTLRAKLAGGYPLATLIHEGDLFADLTMRPLGFERITSTTVRAGTRHRAARFHQYGTRRMPSRQLVNVGAVRRDGAATRAVRNWIVDGRRSAAGVSP